MSQPDSRRHHYVPAGYIGLFAEPRGRYGRLHVWDKEQGKRWISSPDKVAWVEDLYRLDPGEPPHAVEDGLAAAEKTMIPAIREIEANPLRAPTVGQADAIISFVSLQIVRSPELLEAFDRSTRQVLRSMLQMIVSKPEIYESEVRKLFAANPTRRRADFPTYERAREDFRGEEFQVRLNKGFLVGSLLRSQDAVFKVMTRMKLCFHWVSGKEDLVTASRPVLLVPPRDAPPYIPVGIATAEAVVMPLTPKLLFIARSEDFQIIATPATPGLATQTNHQLALRSSQVYSRVPFELSNREEF